MSLKINDLDFDSVKVNLKEFLRNQTEFQDFDFEGAGINIILDLLAYTTHYVGVHANFSLNEMFLATAQLRNSVVTKAKELNYFPKQYQSSTANVTLSIIPPAGSSDISLTKGTYFTASKDNKTYQFVLPSSVVLSDNGMGKYENTFDILEGRFQTDNFSFSDDTISYELSSTTIDDSTVSVIVNGVVWEKGNDKILSGNSTKYYFISEDKNKKISIYFGDGVLSPKPSAGSSIEVEYLVTSGPLANDISSFNVVTNLAGYNKSDYTLTTNLKSSGGSYPESVSRIKKNAPKFYSSQGRAVTVDDYTSILLNNFSDIQSISVWGGEDNNPPQYGSVFICINPKSSNTLSPNTKKYLTNDLLKKYSVITVSPVIVDPEYIYVDLSVNLNYDTNKTSLSKNDITLLVSENIKKYFLDNLTDFNSVIRNSKLLNIIDLTENSILGSSISFNLKRKINGKNSPSSFIIEYNNSLQQGTILSDNWGSPDVYYLKDNNGIIEQWKNNALFNGNVGSVDYAKGIISLVSFNAYLDATITINASPSEFDIYSKQKNLILLDNLTVNSNGI